MLRLLAISHCLFIISRKVISTNETGVFTISTNGCTIRRFPLFSENIETFVRAPTTTRNCSENSQLVDANNTHLWIINDSLEIFNIRVEEEFFCCYRSFKSVNMLENVTYGECIEFKKIIAANHEFVRVECFYFDEKVYDDFFVFKYIQPYMRTDNLKSYNVLVIGIESVSRMNFHRTMVKTSDFLRRRGSIELLGYNKVGDNSYPNLFPLLTGHNFKFVKSKCFGKHNSDINTLCPFIWDNFKRAGYHTALASDSIAGLLGEFEYQLTKIPTDFYLQTVMYEARHLFKNKNYNYHQCLGAKYFYKILLDYIKGLTETLKTTRLFGFFWEESVSHEHLNNPHIMDEDYFQFLTNLEESSYLNESVIIFVSDHGMRWGDIVRTEQGRQEERLPLLQALFPKSFKRRFKLAVQNFQLNRHRLTTPYDVYLTLLDIMDPSLLEDTTIMKRSKSNKCSEKSSLFLPISTKRTCKSVQIEEHWCSCYKGKKLEVGNLVRIFSAQFLVNHINELLAPFGQCQKLSLARILEATVVKRGKLLVYSIVLETYPGNAILDGTVLKERDTWTVSGTVSRLNRYQNNSCIGDDSVRLYCFCE